MSAFPRLKRGDAPTAGSRNEQHASLSITGRIFMRRIVGVALATAALSCTPYRAPIVPVAGDKVSLELLTGRWEGDFKGTQTGRTGSITFSLQASGDSATGEVTMEDPLHQYVIRPADTPDQHSLHASKPQVLFIRFVGVRDGSIYGHLEPYVAPDCDCVVSTGFTGYLRGDTVSGTYYTEAQTVLQHGVWRVIRQRIASTQR
jgi:hypothetical protein